MNAEVEIKQKNTTAINDDAIVSYEGKDYVFFQNNQFEL